MAKPKKSKKISLKVRKGDKVRVIAGKDKGAEGTIIRAIPRERRVVVEHVNMVTKAQRPTQANPQGGLVHLEAPLHVSNVMLVCPKCNQPTRVGYNMTGEKKVRRCKKCGADID